MKMMERKAYTAFGEMGFDTVYTIYDTVYLRAPKTKCIKTMEQMGLRLLTVVSTRLTYVEPG